MGPGDGSAKYLSELAKCRCHARVQCEYDNIFDADDIASEDMGAPTLSRKSFVAYHPYLPKTISHLKRRCRSTLIAGSVTAVDDPAGPAKSEIL